MVRMSDANGALSERDRQVLEASGGGLESEVVDGEDAEEGVEYVRRDEFDELRDLVETTRREMAKLRGRVTEIEESADSGVSVSDDAPLIEKYRQMLENGDMDVFDNQPTLRRAVEIHQQWHDWKQSLGTSDSWSQGISTSTRSNRRYKPMQIKVDLEGSTIPSGDLEAKEVHRAMKMLAKKSGQDEDDIQIHNDDGSRKHITGGIYEYHQRTSPDHTKSDIKHVVVRT